MSNARRVAWLFILGSMLTIGGCEDDPVDPLATARVEVVSGGQQNATTGTALTQPVTVRVLSQDGTPLPRVVVSWIVLEGGGTVAPDSVLTNEAGMAATQWTLGDAVGTQAILAKTH